MPYRVAKITLAAPALPLGTSLGQTSYVVVPRYRSGTLIQVGEDGTVYLRATLMHASGEPFADVVGEIVSIDHPTRPALVLMTNSIGRFTTTGLTPGRYAIRIDGYESVDTDFEVPAGFAGVYAPGIITIEEPRPSFQEQL